MRNYNWDQVKGDLGYQSTDVKLGYVVTEGRLRAGKRHNLI